MFMNLTPKNAKVQKKAPNMAESKTNKIKFLFEIYLVKSRQGLNVKNKQDPDSIIGWVNVHCSL